MSNVEIPFEVAHFPRYARRQDFARVLARYEVFKHVLSVKGSIIEAGVHHADGLFSWAHFSAALEPYQIHRRVIGFDTFSGFAGVAESDHGSANDELHIGGFKGSSIDSINRDIERFDSNRFLAQYPKLELVEGDATETIPRFVRENQHLVVALLYLDFDLYEPTKVALTHLLPRMPRGSVICFDEINNEYWPGETVALAEELGIQALRLQSIPFDPNIAFAVLE